tara:strand:- start:2524 stop:2874 length:351 start_codon:yes stop_codon:yes gene_type:complete
MAKLDFDKVEGQIMNTGVQHYSYTGSNEKTTKIIAGEAFGGRYIETILGTKFNVGEPMAHKFESDDGDLFTLPACGLLNNLISRVDVGQSVACRYNGKVAMTGRDGEAHTWELKKV